MTAVVSLSKSVGKKPACKALTVPRATFYRQCAKKGIVTDSQRPVPPLALSTEERQAILDVAHEKRF